MSNRTIIELNHDDHAIIMNDPSGFLAAIDALMRHGYNGNNESQLMRHIKDGLELYGVTVTPTCHHSDDRVLRIGKTEVRF